MNAESASTALSRRQSLALSPARFRSVAGWTVAWLILIVATGATVRLTGSGLGCHHWPGCQPNEFLPARGFHSDVEFSNRVVATLTVLATFVLALGALVTRALSRGVKVLAWAVFVGTLAQAPLGAITVYYDLNPYLVITHLLLSLVVLGLGVLVLLEATRVARGRAPELPALARTGGAVLLAAVSALVVTGTLATAAGPHPGSTSVRRVGSFQPSIAVHVRATAAFGIVFVLLAVWAWRERARYPWLLRGCAGLLGLLALQMAIGETQYRNGLPWWLVLIHVTVAACVFAWTVGLVARLWHPVAPGRT
ncbi:MAG TPA: COX15/CtaA family protein [Gaiellaceae bacterium]|nr:COX15/CtaA family protein [Gaiellaceae bacterium]